MPIEVVPPRNDEAMKDVQIKQPKREIGLRSMDTDILRQAQQPSFLLRPGTADEQRGSCRESGRASPARCVTLRTVEQTSVFREIPSSNLFIPLWYGLTFSRCADTVRH